MVNLQQTKDGQFFLNVPKAIATAKGWKKGMVIEFIIDNLGNIIIKPK